MGVYVQGSLSGVPVRGVSVRGVSVKRGLCPGGLCQGVSVKGGLCQGNSVSRGVSAREPPYSNVQAVHILLECIPVYLYFSLLYMYKYFKIQLISTRQGKRC